MTTAPGGVQLLSHFPLKWNNQLKQIGGNFDNKRSSALHAKTNGWRGHLHMAYFRETMFDLWRSWVVSMSKERTLPFCDRSAPTSDFHVHRTDGEDRNVLDRANVQLNLFSKSWSDFSCHYRPFWRISSGLSLLWNSPSTFQERVLCHYENIIKILRALQLFQWTVEKARTFTDWSLESSSSLPCELCEYKRLKQNFDVSR